MSTPPQVSVAVIGAGVVGAAIAHALARRGVSVMLLESEREPGLGASGTNSGILHTGFDSPPGELETRLILASARLRDPVQERLGVPVLRCGALLAATDAEQARALAELGERARSNGVEVERQGERSLAVPGEAVTDPAAFTQRLAAAAVAGGAELHAGSRVVAIEPVAAGLALHSDDGQRVSCAAAVNCAGLRADEVATLVGDGSFSIYPRKGEFFVFEPPGGEPLERILLPVPDERGKGVLVFPTVDGKVIAGPTAHDQADKDDWTVRDDAFDEVMPKATRMLPALEDADPICGYAGLRPAGRDCNYVIGPSPACPELINVAAIRSTGLTASLGIAEHVVSLLEGLGIELGDERELPPVPAAQASEPWWQRAARRDARV